MVEQFTNFKVGFFRAIYFMNLLTKRQFDIPFTFYTQLVILTQVKDR